MSENLKIALLWIIRENQPISFREILQFLKNTDRPQLPKSIQPAYLASAYHHRGADLYLRDLIDAGLVQSEDNSPVDEDSKLRVTPRLGIIQELFDFSLTDILNHPEKSVKAYPIFGEPLRKDSGNDWTRIFMAMPFQEIFFKVFKDHILNVTNELGVSCKHGGDFFSANSIVDEVWSGIYHSELCIVDCTGKNANVFYELGIAHTLGRKCILIAQDLSDIPFDVRHLRAIPYTYTPPGMREFEATLKKTIQTELIP